jgi:uncharacterized protein (UPF0276 family)
MVAFFLKETNMQYACNFSPELLELLDQDKTLCDYIKIGAFGGTLPYLEKAFSYKPLILHGFGWHERGGMANVHELDFDLMNLQLEQFETPFLGMHAMAFEKDLIEMQEPILAHMSHVFSYIQSKLKAELIVENMDSSPFYDYDTTVIESVKPEFIRELLNRTGLKMLLDTSHALVSAYQLGMPIYDYLEALPLEAVREIHFTGSFFRKEQGYLDIHGIMGDEDIRLASFLAKHPRIQKAKELEMVTLEYGGLKNTNKEAVLSQLGTLKTLFG